MKRTSTGPFVDSNFSPSCSWIAVKIDGASALDDSDASAPDVDDPSVNAKARLKSQLPSRSVRSTTVRPTKPDRPFANCESGKPPNTIPPGDKSIPHDTAPGDAAGGPPRA